jgi:hypothetical protein
MRHCTPPSSFPASKVAPCQSTERVVGPRAIREACCCHWAWPCAQRVHDCRTEAVTGGCGAQTDRKNCFHCASERMRGCRMTNHLAFSGQLDELGSRPCGSPVVTAIVIGRSTCLVGEVSKIVVWRKKLGRSRHERIHEDECAIDRARVQAMRHVLDERVEERIGLGAVSNTATSHVAPCASAFRMRDRPASTRPRQQPRRGKETKSRQ